MSREVFCCSFPSHLCIIRSSLLHSFEKVLSYLYCNACALIRIRCSNGKASPQALVQWTEVSNHPGLVFALLQSTSNPVVLLMKQDEIQVHELKVFSSKAKVSNDKYSTL